MAYRDDDFVAPWALLTLGGDWRGFAALDRMPSATAAVESYRPDEVVERSLHLGESLHEMVEDTVKANAPWWVEADLWHPEELGFRADDYLPPKSGEEEAQ